MFFSWITRRRRRKLLAASFPDAWEDCLGQNVQHDAGLSPTQKQKLRNGVKIFVAEKHWAGCGGLEMTDEVKVTVAGQACLLLLGIEGEFCFERVKSILVYPDAFYQPSGLQSPYDLVDEDRAASGEAWYGGPVILSWEDVLRGGRRPDDGRNLVLHEFAHQIDALDGEMGGSPPIGSRRQDRRFRDVVGREFRRLEEAVARGRRTLLDDYGATNPAEFFAVATECFFEQPVEMRHRHRELFEVLHDFYRLDPTEWVRQRSP